MPMMEPLSVKLEQLGLAQYSAVLSDNGFEDWDTVLDITEEDLDHLGFKRGHRRILQKEIATQRGSDASSPTATSTRLSSPTGRSLPGSHAVAAFDGFEKKVTKRRYRWHPRADPNAPKKPKTAYVNFADHLRSDPYVSSLSFVDIAREVGRRWQAMAPGLKQQWENQAAQAMQVYEDQMDAYRGTKQYQDYQDYLETFKRAPGKSARQKIKNSSSSAASITSPRRSDSSGPDRSPSRSLDSPTLSAVEDGAREECNVAVGAAVAELGRFRQSVEEEPFTTKTLPSEPVSRHAIAALMEGGTAIFHVIGVAEAEALIHRVYRSSSPLDTLSFAELCAIAALGAQQAKDSIPARTRQQYFTTACAILENLSIIEGMHMKLMRMFLCLALYSINEKQLSARTFISAGLTIAKSKVSLMGDEDSRRVYRTLVFTECWLSQMLGYAAHGLNVHLKNISDSLQMSGASVTVEDSIQWQAIRIATIGNEISNIIRQQETVSEDAIRYLANHLDIWQRELPRELQLASLSASRGSPSGIGLQNERAMSLVHIYYLGAVIMVYGQPLAAAENSSRGPANIAHLLHYRGSCLAAGEQISRLMGTVTSNGGSTSQSWGAQSWLLVYSAFSASNVLLLGAAQALRERSTNDFDRLISHSRTCLATLSSCAQDEPVAARYLEMMSPVFEALRRLRESPHVDLIRRNSNHKISINDLLTSDSGAGSSSPKGVNWSGVDAEVPAIVTKVTELLREPFPKPQAMSGGASMDPYPTPPSNADTLFWFRN